MLEKKILIADDEIEVLNILEKRLKDKNYIVKAVSRGKDVIEACKGEKFDLLLLDIAMPDMDGYTVAEKLKTDKVWREIPIIFVTGKNLEYTGIQKRLETLGVDDFLCKPSTFEDILAKIQEVIG